MMNNDIIIPVAPSGFKSGFVGIIGRPNVGKSTLMNQSIGQKIAIASSVAQTTRNLLRGILTTDRAQLIFVDTPGIHKPHHELGKILVKNAIGAIDLVDVVLLVADSSVAAGSGDRFIVEMLEKARTPVILGLNKSDLQTSNYRQIDESYAELVKPHNWPIVKFSARNQTGLSSLQDLLIQHLKPGPYYYPPDLVTDRPERFIIAELIREQILLHARQEVPHAVAIVIERIEETESLTRIFAAINVERSSQKAILIGKNGSMLKTIGTGARGQIQKLIDREVYLKLFVKVEPKWRESRHLLSEFGYSLES